jgi:hypothetical protein
MDIKATGSNASNIAYRRGLSAYVKVVNNLRTEDVIFNNKILLSEEAEFPKINLDSLPQYDLKILVQLVIKLFDTFALGVIKEDFGLLRSIGLDPEKDMNNCKNLKNILLKCQHS